MVVNYISENISHLVEKSKLTQDDFGDTFGLKRGAINSYVRKIAIPKIETIQKICNHYEISIDNFVNEKLSDLKAKKYVSDREHVDILNEPPEGYGIISLKYVSLLENAVEDKDKIIKDLELKLQDSEIKRKQA
jgi:transcriptional regulator with XRE-family HTH domain